MNTTDNAAPSSAPQSLNDSKPQRRRGRKKQISRELAVDLVRHRRNEGTTDDDGIKTPRRTLEEFARAMVEYRLVSYELHPATLSRLFKGHLYPDLEIDGEPVEWAKLPPSKGRGPASGRGTVSPDGRTFREVVESLERQLERLRYEHNLLRLAVDELRAARASRAPQPEQAGQPGGAP